ncbi:hypothetical protein LOC50_03665 [Pseudoalteromonas sp. SCSIO 43095]|uniref:hypothetical protein n=1 Tax=Pseudoalteromonas sp. SCSIO 43095 TaxID=2894202 RepID=UPI00202B4831|nr:hypothetical protein [Pseudoalteromonas sp. SCSIO 43095]URQ99421.1 hypothetical protein LOC50_03665 [Pseudoalteromonas sp. SCSIO 43095]
MDNKEMNMESDFKNDFFTKEQLQSLINIPIHDVMNDLNTYIYYEGIVSEIPFDDGYIKTYVAGFIKQKKKLVDGDSMKNIYHYTYECGEYCSRPDLSYATDLMTQSCAQDEKRTIYFNYIEFIECCDRLGVPLITKEKPKSTFEQTLNKKTEQYEDMTNIPATYPPELQLILDAYKYFYVDKLEREDPPNYIVKEWLLAESKIRGITHATRGVTYHHMSKVKIKAIASIIKPI